MEQGAVRPIGVKHLVLRCWEREVVLQNKQEFVNYLEPQQLGLSVAGSVKLIFSVRMMLEEYRSFICVKIDARNAFNSVFRAAIVRACLEEPSLAHLAWYAATSLAPYTAREILN